MATLVLNADAQPMNFLPLSVISWEEAIRYLCLDKVSVMSWYEDWVVRSVSWETRVPAVVMLTEYQKPKQSVRLSKRNIYLRDNHKCQYCGIKVTNENATLDHVIPQSKGGRGNWQNLTTSCGSCNSRKGDKDNIKPFRMPYKPEYWELAHKRKQHGYEIKHPSWLNFIG